MRAIVSAVFIIAALAAVPVSGAEWWEVAKDMALDKMVTDEAKETVLGVVEDTALEEAANKFIETESDEDSITVTNWSDMYIEVTAMGTANVLKAQNEAHALILAEEAARALAYRKLTERAYGVYVNSRNIIKDGVTADDTVLVACEGYINNAKERRDLQPDNKRLPRRILGHSHRRQRPRLKPGSLPEHRYRRREIGLRRSVLGP
jgi:hypothetical protein